MVAKQAPQLSKCWRTGCNSDSWCPPACESSPESVLSSVPAPAGCAKPSVSASRPTIAHKHCRPGPEDKVLEARPCLSKLAQQQVWQALHEGTQCRACLPQALDVQQAQVRQQMAPQALIQLMECYEVLGCCTTAEMSAHLQRVAASHTCRPARLQGHQASAVRFGSATQDARL